MLVLSRKINETICIGQNVRITIISVIGDRVKLGIDAPRDVVVNREEIQKKIDASESKTQEHKNG